MRRTKLQDAILTSLEVAGVLAIALVAPNVVQLLKKRYTTRSIQSASQRLIQKGYIAWDDSKGKRRLQLTSKGRMHLSNDRLKVKIPKRWDGKWRLVIFDIAEPRRRYRTLLRQTLEEIGFERLQDSVWVFPYDCEELITLLKADYGLGKEVLYIIADTIERDSVIRSRFKL